MSSILATRISRSESGNAFMKTLLTIASCLGVTLSFAQQPAPSCFFAETFDGPGVPSGWDIGPQIEQQDQNGVGTGSFTDAWVVGNADDANSNGYFEVSNVPYNNSFIMANDDADPCNCDMSAIRLEAPSIDLSVRVGSVLEFRIFHEGLYGAGDPVLELSDNGGVNWTELITIPASIGEWQHQFIDLSSYDGSSDVRFRFLWSDSSNWVSGIAIDDICVSERFTNDLTLTDIFTAEISDNAFDPSVRTQEYSVLPLTQVDELIIGAEFMNRGTSVLTNVQATISLTLGGGIHVTSPIASLAPGETQRVFVNTGWSAITSGELQLNATSSHDSVDDDPADDNGSTSFLITSPGAAGGFAQMGIDGGIEEYSLDNDSNELGVGVLLEALGNGDRIFGLGVILGPNTAAGTEIQAILLDGSLQQLDSSGTIVIDPSHIAQSALGNFMYLPFDSIFTLDQDRDLYAMVYSDGAESSFLSVATSGAGPIGSALFFNGTDDTWDFPLITPMIRAYFSDPLAVSVIETNNDPNELSIYPSPADGHVYLDSDNDPGNSMSWEIYDMQGSLVWQMNTSTSSLISTTDWPSGIYIIKQHSGERVISKRFVVSH